MKTVAEILAEELQRAGIEVVFGLPGGETVEFLDALRKQDIRFVLVHRESSAVFMAAASARLTGKTAACLTTLGPGATNAVTGVAHAFLDRAPVLAITAQSPERLVSRHTHQVVDLEALFTPITKATLALKPDGADETVRQAVALARSGRPGPVHLRLENDDAVSSAKPRDAAPSSVASTDRDPVETADALQAGRELLYRSQRPLILAGLGLEPEAPYDELRELAESVRAPIIVTAKAKGAVPDDHPLYAGTIGLTKTDPVYAVLDDADCIVAVGFDVVELVRPWSHPAALLWVAPWENRDPKISAAAEFVGPMRPTLNGLLPKTSSTVEDWGETRVRSHRMEHPGLYRAETSPVPMTPQGVYRAIRESIPPDTLITTDVGAHKILACLDWPALVPNRFMVSNGLSSMGYALPAAIAASLARPGEPCVCTTGDAGLLMILGELNTVARLAAPVTIVVFKDNALDLIRSHQNRMGKPTFGTEFQAPDFVRIAEAHGITACRVSDEESCKEAVERAVNSNRPALIEANINPSTYPTTPKSTG
jgi:acetolactate synthase-1/2/3 large subunit